MFEAHQKQRSEAAVATPPGLEEEIKLVQERSQEVFSARQRKLELWKGCYEQSSSEALGCLKATRDEDKAAADSVAEELTRSRREARDMRIAQACDEAQERTRNLADAWEVEYWLKEKERAQLIRVETEALKQQARKERQARQDARAASEHAVRRSRTSRAHARVAAKEKMRELETSRELAAECEVQQLLREAEEREQQELVELALEQSMAAESEAPEDLQAEEVEASRQRAADAEVERLLKEAEERDLKQRLENAVSSNDPEAVVQAQKALAEAGFSST